MPYLNEQRVECDPSYGSTWAVVAEGPASEELELGRPLVGPSGRILWPVVKHFARLDRTECHVTNLSKRPLSNEDGAVKLTDEEFEECKAELLTELERCRVTRILAVGALAAKALLGDDFTTMEACNGSVFVDDQRRYIVPCYHPASALRGGGGDVLGRIAEAAAVWRDFPAEKDFGDFLTTALGDLRLGLIAIDTEGTPDDPICLSWACRNTDGAVISGVVDSADVRKFWRLTVTKYRKVVFHNAVWDWGVLEAMGIEDPWKTPFMDTMEKAYLDQEPSKGLKNLAWRYLRRRMRSWSDVVTPHWEAAVMAAREEWIRVGTEWPERRHKKTGKLLKPKPVYSDEAKKLRRLKSPYSVAEFIGFPGPSLRFVPRPEMEDYAVGDAEATLLLGERWS